MNTRKTTEQFIEEARAVHGDRYDYSLVEYTTNKGKVKIVCGIHGISEVGAIEHIRGANCYKCGKENMASKCRITKEDFIKKSKEVHRDKYDYSLVEYVNNKTHVKIICPVHGEYLKSPEKHKAGSGCRKCLSKKNTKTTESFVNECRIIHDNFYEYEKTNYIHSNKTVIITCPNHGDFEQKAKTHREGNGCKKCSLENNNFTRHHYITIAENANLYLIKCWNENEEFYKIGKTAYEVKRRFGGKSLPYNYKIIHILNSEIGRIYDSEIELHKKYKNYKYKPNSIFGGHTECYSTQLPIEEIYERFYK